MTGTSAVLSQPLNALAGGLRSGQISATALLVEATERHERLGPILNAYRVWDSAGADSQARAADAAFAAGADVGLLQGLPVGIKDVFGVRGLDTFGGTPRRWPARWEAEGPSVAALRNQLAVFPGKTHTVEFAFGTLGTNPHWGASRNPWDAKTHRVSGGSSCGSGVALLEGSCKLALASDAGGSIRIPASFTGTVGLKVTHGRWPLDGPAIAPTQTCSGLLALSAADLAYGFAAIDVADNTRRDFMSECERLDVRGVRIGVPDNVFWDRCEGVIAEEVRRALADLAEAGARLVPIELPESAEAAELGRLGAVSIPEGNAFIRREFGEWVSTIEPNIWERISKFGDISTQEYLRRLSAMRSMEDRVHARLVDVDVVAWPSSPISPPRLEDVVHLEGFKRSNEAVGRNVYPPNLWNLCSLSMPVALDGLGMPIGLLLSASRGTDRRLVSIACAVERRLGAAQQRLGRPPIN